MSGAVSRTLSAVVPRTQSAATKKLFSSLFIQLAGVYSQYNTLIHVETQFK